MAATGTAATAATGKLLVVLLLGLTAPAAALAGYIEVGNGRAPEPFILRPRGSAACGRAGRGVRAGSGSRRSGRWGWSGAAAGLERLPRPPRLGAVLGAGGRAVSAAAEAK